MSGQYLFQAPFSTTQTTVVSGSDPALANQVTAIMNMLTAFQTSQD